MIYYRIATPKYHSTAWEWKSMPVDSLEELFRLGRQYGFMPAEQMRVFAASSIEYMDTLLVRENLGLPSNSLTLEQLLQDQQSITDQSVRQFEMGLGWLEVTEAQMLLSPADTESATPEAELQPVVTLDRPTDDEPMLDPEPLGGDHDEPYTFALPEFTPHALAWIKLRAKVQAGELIP